MLSRLILRRYYITIYVWYHIQYMHISNFEFGMLYAIYSLPNTIMVFIGGVFMDRVGNRLASLVFSALIVIGASTVALGPMLGKFWIMLAGRLIFGYVMM